MLSTLMLLCPSENSIFIFSEHVCRILEIDSCLRIDQGKSPTLLQRCQLYSIHRGFGGAFFPKDPCSSLHQKVLQVFRQPEVLRMELERKIPHPAREDSSRSNPITWFERQRRMPGGFETTRCSAKKIVDYQTILFRFPCRAEFFATVTPRV